MEVLTNKSYKQSNNLSRYSNTPYYYHTIDDKYIYGTAKNLRLDTPYSLYTVQQGDTLDSIALEFYNNPTLYWVICFFNHINDAFVDLNVGDKLKIPGLSTIEFEE